MRSIFSYPRLSDKSLSAKLRARASRFQLFAGLLLLTGLSILSPIAAATLPTNFSETPFRHRPVQPDGHGFAPDGRLFVCQQGGQLRVVKNGALLATPFRDADGRFKRRARAAGNCFRSKFCQQSVSLCLLHGHHAGDSQSCEPLHSQRCQP